MAGNRDFDIAFEHLRERIERSRVLAQALSYVEREESHVADGLFDDRAADDGAVLAGDEFRDFGDLSAGETFAFGWVSGCIILRSIGYKSAV